MSKKTKARRRASGRWNLLGGIKWSGFSRRFAGARRWILDRPRWLRLTVGAGVVLAVLAGGASFYRTHAYEKAVTDAKALIVQGFTELAAEKLTPWRSRLIGTADGCEVLMTAHFRSRQANELAEVAAACIQAGQANPTSYVGLAVSRELKGMDDLALQILDGAVQKFPSSPDLPYRRALIFRRLDRKEEAASAYVQTAALAPSNGNVHLEALRYLLTIDKGTEAGQIAQKLRAASINDLPTKLLVARGLYAGGDRDGALAVAREIREKAQNDPAMRAQIRLSFPELGESQDAVAPAQAADQAAPDRGLASPTPPGMMPGMAPPPAGAMPQGMMPGMTPPPAGAMTPPMMAPDGTPMQAPPGVMPGTNPDPATGRDPAMTAPPAQVMPSGTMPGMAPPAGMPASGMPPAAGP